MGLNCSGKIGMIFLIVLNTIFVLLGLGLLIAGILLAVNSNAIAGEIMPLLNEIKVAGMSFGDLIRILAYAIIGVGAFVIIVSGMGAIGACCKNKCLLITYAVIVIFIALVEITAVVLWFYVKFQLSDLLRNQLLGLLSGYRGDTSYDAITVAWNALFILFKCCGVNAYLVTNDFASTQWYQTSSNGNSVLPTHCCKGVTLKTFPTYAGDPCTTDPDTSNAYVNSGCYDGISNMINTYSTSFIGMCLAILAVEIMAVVFAFVLCCAIARTRQVGKIV